MNRALIWLAAIVTLIPGTLVGANPGGVQYLSPLPGSRLVSRASTIIVRPGGRLDASVLAGASIRVTGERSGGIETGLVLSTDGRTIIARPDRMFEPGETVTVEVDGAIATTDGQTVPPFSFTFSVTPLRDPVRMERVEDFDAPDGIRLLPPVASRAPAAKRDSVPADFPIIRIDSVDNPAPGDLFLSVARDMPDVGWYLMILDNAGQPVRYLKTLHHYPTAFQRQANGLLSFADIREEYWFAGGGYCTHKILDTSFAVVDSFQCGNGYIADNHDFMLLPNGHALIYAYDVQPVDMSLLVPGGNPAAMVSGSIVQELDAQRNVIFQWRSWDYIPVLDTYQNTLGAAFDYIHVNGILQDVDGHIVVCTRLTSEIIKINRQTGDIIWRLGGKHNEFTFIDDHAENAPHYFSFPHSPSLLPNGNLLLFDNGFKKVPQYSRAVEYALDQTAKTATMVWEYRRNPDVFGATQGSAQRLPNGNTIIGWGSASIAQQIAATEVTPDGRITFEMSLPQGVVSYAVFRYVWPDPAPAATVTEYDVPVGVPVEFSSGDTIRTGVSLTLTNASFNYNSITVARFETSPLAPEFTEARAPITPQGRIVVSQNGFASFTGDLSFETSAFYGLGDPAQAVIYWREFEGNGLFTPKATTYDPVNQTLTATVTVFGEFIVCTPDLPSQILTPAPVAPLDLEPVNATLPVPIRWSTRGFVQMYGLQVATDSLFSSPVVNAAGLSSSYYEFGPAASGTTYYWRANATNEAGTTAWSAVSRFVPTAPFVSLASPDGGEQWFKDSSYVIRWSDNLPQFVTIDLFEDTQRVLRIADSVRSSHGYRWKVPKTLPDGTTYRIRVSAYGDTSLFDMSAGMFALGTATGVRPDGEVPGSFALFQNYPNPFNPETRIQFTLAERGHTTLKVFDLLGREVAALVDEVRGPGSHEVRWNASQAASGVYLYRLTSGAGIQTRR
ncbi:MAG: hypothetical protein H6Q29_974, partial [Bacteroidetes bacterium]|nr:hypothetical protein [Bacteroidota bacterium]